MTQSEKLPMRLEIYIEADKDDLCNALGTDGIHAFQIGGLLSFTLRDMRVALAKLGISEDEYLVRARIMESDEHIQGDRFANLIKTLQENRWKWDVVPEMVHHGVAQTWKLTRYKSERFPEHAYDYHVHARPYGEEDFETLGCYDNVYWAAQYISDLEHQDRRRQ